MSFGCKTFLLFGFYIFEKSIQQLSQYSLRKHHSNIWGPLSPTNFSFHMFSQFSLANSSEDTRKLICKEMSKKEQRNFTAAARKANTRTPLLQNF